MGRKKGVGDSFEKWVERLIQSVTNSLGGRRGEVEV